MTNTLERRQFLVGGATALAMSACAQAKPAAARTPGATGLTFGLYQCFIATSDHEAALPFYRDTLGFEVRNDVKYEAMRWITLGIAGQAEPTIVLETPFAETEADQKLLHELLAKGLLRGVILSTANCDATFAHVKKSGAVVLQEPTDQDYGVRDCAFKDPSGNMIRFSQKR